VLGVMSLFALLILWGLVNQTIGMAKFGAIGLDLLAPATIGGRPRHVRTLILTY